MLDTRVWSLRLKAEETLGSLRGGGPLYAIYYRYLISTLSQGVVAPEAIGTTREEIQQLYRQGAEGQVHELLRLLRQGSMIYEKLLQFLHYELRQAGLAVQDVGTTEQELYKLRVKGATACAIERLQNCGMARSITGSIRTCGPA